MRNKLLVTSLSIHNSLYEIPNFYTILKYFGAEFWLGM